MVPSADNKYHFYPNVGDMVKARTPYMGPRRAEVGIVVQRDVDRAVPRFKILFHDGVTTLCFFYEIENL